MRALRLYLVLLLLSLLAVAGCQNGTEDEEFCKVYYLNKDHTKIFPKPYELKADASDVDAVIHEYILQLTEDTGDVDYKQPIPEGVFILDYVLEKKLLTLYFNDAYSSMDKIDEALARAAIVRTLTQVDGVECLTFYVGDVPLSGRDGQPVGVMTNDTFIENPGEQINSIQEATLVLYFANQKGDALVKETLNVHYSSNISMEKLVMEHLLEGPRDENAQAAIPDGTKLMNVSVLDGVCYVNLDESFLNHNYNVEEAVVIYSIVNSLSEISTINKVQISVNGDTSGVYRDSFSFDTLYERNLDYVKE